MMTLDLAVATNGGRVHNLSGKERGRDVRHRFQLDELDQSPEAVTISIPNEIYAIAPSFILGFLSPSILKFKDIHAFLTKYKFVGDEVLVAEIIGVLGRAWTPRGRLMV